MMPETISVWVISIVGWVGLLALLLWLLDRIFVYGLGLFKIQKPFYEFLREYLKRSKVSRG